MFQFYLSSIKRGWEPDWSNWDECFNSTLVQLKAILIWQYIYPDLSFNSTLVQLKDVNLKLPMPKDCVSILP